MRDYFELTKPRITVVILLSTGVGFFFGMPQSAWLASLLKPWLLLNTLLGTGLMASGTAALNEWYERDSDARMRRTAHRPIPSGRVTPNHALLFGILVSALGFADLAGGANLAAALPGLFTLLSYLLVYTPLKTRSRLSTTVGAIPGAMPPMIGYAASHGSLNLPAWILAAILFLWQFPHF
jgi:protoheme IX farnesyltransferase